MAEFCDHIKSFLQLVIQELVYIINIRFYSEWVAKREVIKDELTPDEFWSCTFNINLDEEEREVLRRFKDRIVDFTGGNFDKLLRESSSVYLNEDYCKTSLKDYASNVDKKATEYRKSLLVEACILIMGEDKTPDVNRTNRHGNTPLHLISALSLSLDSDFNFFRALLEARANPLATNERGLNILHIIFGGRKAVVDGEGHIKLVKESVRHNYCQDVHPRLTRILSFLTAFVDDVHLDYIKIIPDHAGNTVMHDYIFNILHWTDFGCNPGDVTLELVSQLVDKHGLNLKFIKNQWGHLPIHYSFHPVLFKFLVDKGSDYRVRSSQGETPFLFMLIIS